MDYDEDKRLINLDFNLGKLDDFSRKIAFNKPWVKALMLGGAGYFVGRKATPLVTSILSPHLGKLNKKFGTEFSSMDPKDQKFLSNTMGVLTALALAAPTVLGNIDFTGQKPYLGMNNFSPKRLDKAASAYIHHSMPAYKAQQYIQNKPGMNNISRTATSAVLNTFRPNQQITGGSVIKRAISSGYDAMAGGAVGFLAAHALGLPNPLVTAGISAGINMFRK